MRKAGEKGLAPAARGNRGQAVFDALRQALRDGEIRPGDHLREEQLAEQLDVSRTPVREALSRLLGKGLLERASGRGLVVRRLAPTEVFELYAMREVLEGAAAAFAATHAAPAEIAALGRLQERFAACGPGETEEAARINHAFHESILSAARNRYLNAAIDELYDGVALLGPTTFRFEGRHALAVAEHEQILSALRAGDASTAETAARAHIRAALATREKDFMPI